MQEVNNKPLYLPPSHAQWPAFPANRGSATGVNHRWTPYFLVFSEPRKSTGQTPSNGGGGAPTEFAHNFSARLKVRSTKKNDWPPKDDVDHWKLL